jgi:hypothetical protein
VVHVVGSREASLRVGDRVEDDRENPATPWRQVGRRAVDEAVAEDQRGARRARRRNQATLGRQRGHGLVVHRPERVTRRLGIDRRSNRALPVRTPDEDQGSVVLGDLVEEQMEVERKRLGDAVLRVMSGEVVVPLPGLTRKGDLGVDLDLLESLKDETRCE